MYRTLIADGETPRALCLRLRRPLCMILRANGLFSATWLLSGREIDVPDCDYCLNSQNACPTLVMNAPVLRRRAYIVGRGETPKSVATVTGLPERCVLAHAGGTRCVLDGRVLYLPEQLHNTKTRTVMPNETLSSIAPAADITRIRALNAVWGSVYPGMKLLIPTDAE